MWQSLSTFTCALMMSVGLGLSQPPSPSAAPQKPYRERLLERAQKGEADAQYELGKNYETGRIGLPKDFAQAQHWYGEAAKQGDPFAEFALGVLFNFGKGVTRDYVQAYAWYERAVLHSSGGDRDSMAEMRDRVAEQLSKQQIAEAQHAAQAWKPEVRQ